MLQAELKKESELYLTYLEELERNRKKVEAQAEQVRMEQIAKIEEERLKKEVTTCRASIKLKEV